MGKSRGPPIGMPSIERATTTAPIELAGTSRRKTRSRLSKSKFSCGFCGQSCWGKPSLIVVCGACGIRMSPAEDAL
jgi:hypothetical protein